MHARPEPPLPPPLPKRATTAAITSLGRWLLVLAAILGGCMPAAITQIPVHGGDTPAKTATGDIPDATLRCRVEDLLRIQVWGHPELNHDAVVQEDGSITVPLVGVVPAAGRTLDEIRQDIVNGLEGRRHRGPVTLMAGDRVRMTVWLHDELTSSAEVLEDGTLVLPLAGVVPAQGRDIETLRAEVQRRLAAYIRNPQVSILPEQLHRSTVPNPQVSVLPLKLRPRFVVVLGEVNRPGLVPIHGKLSAMEALAVAGHRDTAALDHLVLIRPTPGAATPSYERLQLQQYMQGAASDQNVALQEGDILVVPKSGIARLDEFIDRFFSRTRPVFDWWIALQEARFSEEYYRTALRLNDLLIDINSQ